MIVYNVTYKVLWSIHEDWLAWLKSEHIADHLASGLFDGHRLFRLLDQDEEEGPTYVVQLFTSSLEKYERFQIEIAEGLQEKARRLWGDRFIGFRTLMTDDTEG